MWIGTMGGMACMEEGQVHPVETGETVWAMVVDGRGAGLAVEGMRVRCTNGRARRHR